MLTFLVKLVQLTFLNILFSRKIDELLQKVSNKLLNEYKSIFDEINSITTPTGHMNLIPNIIKIERRAISKYLELYNLIYNVVSKIDTNNESLINSILTIVNTEDGIVVEVSYENYNKLNLHEVINTKFIVIDEENMKDFWNKRK